MAKSQIKDLTGKPFGKLKVIKQVPKPEGEKRSGTWWLCECECGNTIEVRGATLTIGDRTTCGCKSYPDLTKSPPFGRLTVIERADYRISEDGKRHARWKCLCECGNEVTVAQTELTSGDTQSCGCLKSPNLVGQTFERLKVEERIEPSDPRNQTPHVKYRCTCKCGNETIVSGNRLRSQEVRSCGCLITDTHTTHGMSKTRTYGIWSGAKSRCNNKDDEAYDRYGGRGITFDKRWEDFEVFLADMGEAPEGLTLDRINNDKGYSKENCRWATYQEQGENKRNNFWITANKGTPDEETHTVTEWGRIKGICHATISYRIRILEWDVDTALNTPVDPVLSERASVPKARKRN